jgi:hypothetical protein
VDVKPKVLIASSVEGVEVAREIQTELYNDADCTIWYQGVFAPGEYPLESLIKALDGHQFGIFVLTPDDDVTKLARDEKHLAARDNVIAELFLFIGRYGRSHTFLIAPEKDTPRLPTDLAGLSPLRYRWNKEAGQDLQQAIGAAVNQIRKALKDRFVPSDGKTLAAPPTLSHIAQPDTAIAAALPTDTQELLHYLEDIMHMLSIGSAGMEITLVDPTVVTIWHHNVLEMVVRVFRPRQADVSVTWLRPTCNPDQIALYAGAGQHHGAAHYKYRKEEGLAGKVWARGQAACCSPARPHEWWVVRKDCDNSTYICVPIGEPGSEGGVLAVGSDSGFELTDIDLDIVKTFAKILSLSIGRRPALRAVGQHKKRSG